MMKSKGFARVSTFAALKASLQQYLGHVAKEPEPPRLNFSWLRPPTFGWREAMVAGAHVVIGLRDGRRYVGELMSFTTRTIALALWGCGGAVTRFATSAVIGAGIVGSHGHREERAVCERQRRGDPACIGEPKKRKAPAATKSAGASDS
jgi:hypothetical protein